MCTVHAQIMLFPIFWWKFWHRIWIRQSIISYMVRIFWRLIEIYQHFGHILTAHREKFVFSSFQSIFWHAPLYSATPISCKDGNNLAIRRRFYVFFSLQRFTDWKFGPSAVLELKVDGFQPLRVSTFVYNPANWLPKSIKLMSCYMLCLRGLHWSARNQYCNKTQQSIAQLFQR